MSVNANLPLASISELSAKLRSEWSKMEGQINDLRTQAQRDPNFTGNAAEKYDQYMDDWAKNANGLNLAIEGAANLLKQFHEQLELLNGQVANGFNV
jgi:uncharacterized protein YukE